MRNRTAFPNSKPGVNKGVVVALATNEWKYMNPNKNTAGQFTGMTLKAIRATAGFGSLATGMIAAVFIAGQTYAVAEPDENTICRATGQPCFIGIDADVFY